MSAEVKKYLEKLEADKKWREENMPWNKEPTPANNRSPRGWPWEQTETKVD
jgi:hypothetical protein